MMLFKSSRHRAFAISAATCCVLLVASSKSIAGAAAESDVPSVKVAPQPRSVDQQIKLAGDYFAGRGVAQDLNLSAYWYEKAAGAGDPQAQYLTGYFYEAGIGVAKDPARAAHWYQLAAAGGSLRAKVSLGISYLWGTGVEKNEKLSMQLLTEAAQAAAAWRPVISGTSMNSESACQRIWPSAKNGIGKERRCAIPWRNTIWPGFSWTVRTIRATPARLRSCFAIPPRQVSFPLCIASGSCWFGTPSLVAYSGEATALLTTAANSGNWRSSVLLGVLDRDGVGVATDSTAAYYHFRVAALQGGDEAKNLLDRDLRLLSDKLGAGEAQAIDSKANDWYRQHHFVLEFVDKDGENQTGRPALAIAAPEDGDTRGAVAHLAGELAAMTYSARAA